MIENPKRKYKRPSIFMLLFSVLVFSSFFIKQSDIQKTEFKFLFIGHAYDWGAPAGDKVDERIEQINIEDYEGVWLGGDVCANTMLNPKTAIYLDKVFNLKNPNTHFVLGNHDYRDHNLDVYFEATGRPDFYTSSFMTITMSVINTNLNSSHCEQLNAQYRMLEQVTDTLESATHYVLLMHHQIFRDIAGLEGFKSNGVCSHYSMNCDRVDSYFQTDFYPKLVELESKGIEVIVVVGDTGWDKGSHQKSSEGIDFLASGINNSFYKSRAPEELDKIPEDLLLEFIYTPNEAMLDWQFKSLNELVGLSREDWLSL